MSLLLLGILNQQASGGGAAPAFDLLETTTLTSSASSITFSGLSAYAADYKHLQVRAVLANTGNSHRLTTRFNGDNTTANYRSHNMLTTGSTPSSLNNADNYLYRGITRFNDPINGANYSNAFGAVVSDYLDFANTSKNKTVRTMAGFGTSVQKGTDFGSGFWNNTDAITSITFLPGSGNFAANCRVSLYGIKG